MPRSLALAAERQAESLRDAGWVRGQASGDDLARALQIPVEEVAGLPAFLHGTIDWALHKVLVAQGLPPALRQFTICHELAELHLPERLPHDLHEVFCDRSAAAQLMPRCDFVRSLLAHGLDLSALRLRWAHCSFEALARRAPEVWPGLVASAWRGTEPRWHRSSEGLSIPARLAALEREALGDVYGHGRSLVRIERSGWQVHALRTSTLPNCAVLLSECLSDSPLRQRHWVEEQEDAGAWESDCA